MKKTTVKSHFETYAEAWLADSYDGTTYDYPTAHHRARLVARILKQAGAHLAIADLGCGGGNLACVLGSEGHVVSGIDVSSSMVEIAKKCRDALPLETRNRLNFHVGDLEKNELPGEGFDVVISVGVIGYLEDDSILFRAMHKLLKPGGIAIVSCRNRLFNMNSLSFRTKREIEDGSAVALLDEMETYATPLSMAATDAFLDRLAQVPKELERISGAVSSDASGSELPSEVTSPEYEVRQHTPLDLNRSAEAFDFVPVSAHGVHPHLLEPRLNKLLPPHVFNMLSGCLEALEDEPVSLLWSSVFISVFRKA